MKTRALFLSSLMAVGMFLISCKDKNVTDPEERIEENHSTKIDNTNTSQAEDTTEIIEDSLIDPNMKNQSDTHGRDTDAGR